MSLYVMVTADFPDVTSDERAKIYECLEKKNWTKIHNTGRDIDTVWYAQFKDGATYEGVIRTSKNDFCDCSKEYTKAKLAIMVGENKPTIHTCE